MDPSQRVREWVDSGEYLRCASGHSLHIRTEGVGEALVMLHGWPLWSYDFSSIWEPLTSSFRAVTFDFLGYGASDKPPEHRYSVAESASHVVEVLKYLRIRRARFLVHNFGALVGQELLDRFNRGELGFRISGLYVLNTSIIHEAFRPPRIQQLIGNPIVGPWVARMSTKRVLRRSLDRVRGPTHPLTDDEFEDLAWGASRMGGLALASRLVAFNTERVREAKRWEAATESFKGPIHMIWGLADPISGRHVLESSMARLPDARMTMLEGAGHFPHHEQPRAVIKAVLEGF